MQFFAFSEIDYKKECKRQTQSSPPNTTRRRSNSDATKNENITKKKISSLSFPLSIDALLKVHYPLGGSLSATHLKLLNCFRWGGGVQIKFSWFVITSALLWCKIELNPVVKFKG